MGERSWFRHNRERFCCALSAAFAVLAALLFGSLASTAVAQSPTSSAAYITPFPQGDRYQLRVLGDDLASGLASALTDAFKQEGGVSISATTRSNFGLSRSESNALFSEAEAIASSGGAHIVVIMVGVVDRVSIRAVDGGRLQPGTPEWKEAYGNAAERLIKTLKSGNIAVYWVGLPVMGGRRGSIDNETASVINDAVREAAYLNGAKFIETWTGFTDASGNFTAYGPDVTGQTKRLRESDGVFFTAAGYRKLANYVDLVIRRDLAQARALRNIPLAGDDEEQARIVYSEREPQANRAERAGADGKAGETKAAGGLSGQGEAQAVPKGTSTPSGPLSAGAFSGGAAQGDFVLGDMNGDLTAIAVISPLGNFSIRDVQRQTPLADRLYFRVLSKGESLPAKPGRADDFSWNGQSLVKSQ